jgi:nitroreductase
VEVTEAIRRRHMVRSFSDRPIEPAIVESLVGLAGRGPSAGNTRGTAWVVLRGEETARYWSLTTTEEWRGRSRRWPGLSRAPVVALSLCSPDAYVERYGEEDKRSSGLGPDGGIAAWPVPYWFGDAAFATMLLLLAATDAGLAGAFLGAFRGEAELLAELGIPQGWRLFGAVLIGHPDGEDRPSASLARDGDRDTPPVHWGRWRPD